MKLKDSLFHFIAFFISLQVLLLAPLKSSGQYDYYKMSLGVGVGVTHSWADIWGHNASMASKLEFSYFLNEFINVGVNYQTGKIVGGNRFTDPYQREFTNNFQTIDLNVKLQLGLLGLQEESGFFNAIKGIYIGTGIGGIANNHRNPVRYHYSPNYKFPGYDRSKEMFIPFMTGINFHIPNKYNVSRMVVSVNFQGNVVSGEGLDSYDFNGTQGKQNVPDIFTYISLGLSYQFGEKGWFGGN